MPDVSLEGELSALAEAREAVQDKLDRFVRMQGASADTAADAVSQEYIDAVVGDTIDQLQQELVVFGRVDDEQPWRIGLYGIDRSGDQLVVDWRAPFAESFYQAAVDDPRGLNRRVSYVGSIDDLLVEDLVTGDATGSSPLLAELSREKGELMRAAVATLQSEQDTLVRRHPDETLVLRGGPGTGKTVVGLHRAAWLVYNDRRITSDRILVVGPSDRFLRYVAGVLPTLGERRIRQTTFAELLGPQTDAGHHPAWPEIIGRFVASLPEPDDVRVRGKLVPADELADLLARSAALPWRERRKVVIDRIAASRRVPRDAASKVLSPLLPTCTTAQAVKRLRRPETLDQLEMPDDLRRDWLSVQEDGAVTDELRARLDGVPARYSHVIVDEAQDLGVLQLAAVRRRATGLTLLGDDAQRSHRHGLGLRAAARELHSPLAEMRTAYRQSAEIAAYLNDIAASNPDLDAVDLIGVRPTGVAVRFTTDPEAAAADLAERWTTVARISAADVWEHQGIEYDAVVVERSDMSPRDVYLAASRAAHELVLA